MEFDVLIEIPRGHATSTRSTTQPARIQLDRTLFTSTRTRTTTATSSTLGEDGDPLDALVLLEEPDSSPGAHPCRAIGMFRMTDEAGGDDKVLCVPSGDPRLDAPAGHHHMPEFDRLEIQHFFEVYKDLEPGKSVEGATWTGRAEAEAEIINSRDRLASSDAHGH